MALDPGLRQLRRRVPYLDGACADGTLRASDLYDQLLRWRCLIMLGNPLQIQPTLWVAMAAEYGQEWHDYRLSNRVESCNNISDVHLARLESQGDWEALLS